MRKLGSAAAIGAGLLVWALGSTPGAEAALDSANASFAEMRIRINAMAYVTRHLSVGRLLPSQSIRTVIFT